MYANILSIAFCFIYLICGYFVSRLIFHNKRTVIRLWMGGVRGMVMMIILPALWAFVFDFTVMAQYSAVFTALIAAGICRYVFRKNNLYLHKTRWPDEMHLAVIIPFLIIGIYLFHTHTIHPENGALYVGQSTYGDLAMHLGFVSSLARQKTFPPMYSILPDTAIGYPFLCDSVSANFHVLGADLRFSMLLPAVVAYLLVLMGVMLFFESRLDNKNKTVFAFLLFFIGGGLGFAYFFDMTVANPGNLSRIFTAFYETPTNYTSHGIAWVNPIADMLVPQRATLFGWTLLFPALYMLRLAAFENETKLFIPLGILAGCMPMVHTHSFLALGILSAVYLFYDLINKCDKKKFQGWIIYGGITMLLAAPQLFMFTFRQAQGFLRFNFNWVNSTDNFIWFYIKNWGLLFLLLPLSYLNLNKKEQRFYNGVLVLWLIAEFIQFQPNPYDNNKLLFVLFAFTCIITANFLFDFYGKIKDVPGREFLAVVAVFALFTSGILTLGREIVSEYQLFSKEQGETARFIKENTDADALFLTATNHNNPVAALSGRNIVCGRSIYVHFIGLDYTQHRENVKLMYTDPENNFEKLSEEYGIDYVLFSSYERGDYNCNDNYFKSRYPVFYENGDIIIYKTA